MPFNELKQKTLQKQQEQRQTYVFRLDRIPKCRTVKTSRVQKQRIIYLQA